MVLVSPRLVVVQTLATQAAWTTRLTSIAQRGPDELIEMVRVRPSAGGRPWARPACKVLDPPRATASRAGVLLGKPSAVLRVRGPLGPSPREALGRLMSRAAERVGMNWTEVAADGPVGPSQWHHRLNHRGEVSGRMVVELSSDDELRFVVAALTDAVVNLTGTPTLLEVEAIDSGAGNARVGCRVPTRG